MTENIAEAVRALSEKPLAATSAERFLILDELKETDRDKPQPTRFAHHLSALLSRVSTPVKSHDRILGRTVDRVLTPDEEKRFQAFIASPLHPSHGTFFSSGHGTYSWESLVTLGVGGFRKLAEEGLAKTDDPDKKTFFAALVAVYDAITAYIRRYASAARKKGLSVAAENLERVASDPPETFTQALQLCWIVTLINCAYISENPTLTLGRLDQILLPFYRRDLADGRLTREEAAATVTDYYCKHNLIMGRGEHQVGDETNSTTFKRITNFDAPQYLLLAGSDGEGNCAVNELTELFASCIVPAFKNPVVVVRYAKEMDKTAPALWKIFTEKALASSSLMFYNDENVLAAFRRIGLPEEDARKYEHFGCNWCSPGEDGAWMQSAPRSKHYANVYASDAERKALDVPYAVTRCNAPHAYPEDFMIVLRDLAARPEGSVTVEDFYTAFFARYADFIDRKLARLSRELAVRKRRPSCVISFTDCFRLSSARSGECFSASAKYHFELQAFSMFGTVADCFIAVDKLVMREKKLTLKTLLAACEADFEGFPEVLALLRKTDKYGMDTPLSNAHAERLARTASELVFEKNKPYFEKQKLFLVPCMQSDTWHLKLGETYGATPDGRRAFTPFSQNTRPSNGACTAGLAGMFNSLLHLPHDGLVSGALNLDVDARDFAGEKGRALFAAILGDYFDRGGLHAQVSALNVNDLFAARVKPEEHRDLRVRVTGYSGIFVDFCERLQDDIIERFR